MTRNTLLTLFCLAPVLGIAQLKHLRGMQPDRERLESMEVAYLTRELNLSPEDAQKFWPVFNKYREEVKAVITNTALTDPLDRQQKVLDLRKKYRPDFTRVLGAERGPSVFSSEEQFRQKVKNAVELRNKTAGRRPMMQQRLQKRGPNFPGFGGF